VRLVAAGQGRGAGRAGRCRPRLPPVAGLGRDVPQDHRDADDRPVAVLDGAERDRGLRRAAVAPDDLVDERRHPLPVEHPLEVVAVDVAAEPRRHHRDAVAGELLRAPAEHLLGRGAGPEDGPGDVRGHDAVVRGGCDAGQQPGLVDVLHVFPSSPPGAPGVWQSQ
jgi:hypothetical protein